MSETPNKLEYKFTGKKVLITGGGRGVGRELVSRLYAEGALVYTLEKDAALVTKLLVDFPDRNLLRAETCDISKWEETQSLIQLFGPMDHLVNSAAIVNPVPLMDITEDHVDLMLDVNLKSMICTSQAVAKEMVSAGVKGTIVNIASIAGHRVASSRLVYSTTKAAVLMLTKCLAVELGRFGIRANSVSPALVDTPMTREAVARCPNLLKEAPMIQRQPFKGKVMLEAGDVVNSVLFLLSPLSSLASGADLALDGGILAC